MKSDTEYRVKVLFFPDIEEQNLIPSDNTLNFTIQQSDIFDKKSSIPKEERHISPSEIVLLMLHAEKSKKWDDYFKYLKIESFISAYPAYVRTYKIAEETKKLKIIEDFKKFLKKDRNDYILEYKILNQSLLDDNNYAYVDTLVKRYGIRIPYTYIYRYTLEKYKNFWVITDVQANVIKGQKS